MGRTEPNRKRPTVSPATKEYVPNHNSSPVDLNQVEFHRHGLALVPNPLDKRPGVAFLLKGDAKSPDLRICSCFIAKKQTCLHILKLVEIYKAFLRRPFDRASGIV